MKGNLKVVKASYSRQKEGLWEGVRPCKACVLFWGVWRYSAFRLRGGQD